MFVVSCSMLGFVNRQFLRSTYDLMNRYGKQDSWVVVTGGSDGIGLEICEQMAAKGFNVCIVSRNQEKINEKLKLLIERFPKIKTRAVVFDFSTKTTIEQYKTEIADKDRHRHCHAIFKCGLRSSWTICYDFTNGCVALSICKCLVANLLMQSFDRSNFEQKSFVSNCCDIIRFRMPTYRWICGIQLHKNICIIFSAKFELRVSRQN